MKKPSRKTIVKKLDKLVSEMVRSKGKCERCEKTSTLQPAHIYSRKFQHLRWDFENIICLCAGCHFWMHQNPAEAMRWVETIRNIDDLIVKRRNVTPIKTFQLVELYERLKLNIPVYPNEKVDTFEQHDLSVENENTNV